MPHDKKRGKGGKYKRGNQKEVSLSKDDLQYLIEHTSYDAGEIMEWFRQVLFTKVFFIPLSLDRSGFIDDNPGGTLSKEKMMKMYEAVLSQEKAQEFVDQIFKKFDSDNSGEIDFKVCAQKSYACVLYCAPALVKLCVRNIAKF